MFTGPVYFVNLYCESDNLQFKETNRFEYLVCGLVGCDNSWSDKSQRNVVPPHLNSQVLFYSHSLYRPANRSVKRTRKLSLRSIKHHAQKVDVNVGHTCIHF